jgi:hypothetical protein
VKPVRCHFHLRIPAPEETATEEQPWRYHGIWLEHRDSNSQGDLVTYYPPVVGDTIFVSFREHDSDEITHTQVEIIARDWHYASIGSQAWNYAVEEPAPSLYLLVVKRDQGIFVDEAPLSQAELAE